ncbi:MAG: tetratricopeptide repeat protein [Gemmataceae bacterium]
MAHPPTDIYSLGAILYALVDGPGRLWRRNWPQLSKLSAAISPAAAGQADVPRPLETISLKAIAPNPRILYASANALAADVEHWLADEPVSACPERLPTRVRRWAKRNRMLVGAGLFLLVAIVIGLSIGAALLERARLETDQQRHAAVIAQGKAEAINRFLIDDLLKQADPATNPAGDRLTVRQLLDLATSRLDARTELAGQPEVEAEVRGVMGRAYENLGAHEQASRHYRRAWGLLASVHGATHASTLKARNDYVYVVVDADLSPEGPALARELYAACEAALGAEHLQTARALGILGRVLDAAGDTVEAERALQKSSRLLQASLGPDNHLSLDTDNSLAGLYWRSGQAEKAEPIMRSIVERRRRGARDPDLSLAIGNYGYILLALGRFAEAGAAAEEAVEVGTRSVGPTALGTLSARSLRGYVHEAQGRWSEAERDFVAVLADRRRLLPPTAANVKRSLGHLARLYAKRERWSDAAPYLADLLLAQSPDPARKRDELAQALAAALSGDADPAAAEPLLKQCWDCGKAILAQGDWLRPELASRYGDCLRRRGKYADAEPLLVAAASDVAKAIAPPPWSVPAARRRVADLYDAWGKPAEAAKWR